MARNKHPEQTLEKIIVTAARLFVEKGYEQTSVQDILDATGLSKGGLYHHFKSKEQILNAVMQRRIQYVNKRFQELIRDTPGKNAKEKLKKILGQLAADAETHALDQALASQLDPHFVGANKKPYSQQFSYAGSIVICPVDTHTATIGSI